MGKASAVMYSIANIVNWILLIFSLAGIVFSALALAGVQVGDLDMTQLGTYTLVVCIIMFLAALVIIAMVRKAKKAGTSKGWDVLFLILGILSCNIFYFLGGLFGLIAVK